MDPASRCPVSLDASNDAWPALLDDNHEPLLLDDFKIDSEALSEVDFGGLPALDDTDILLNTPLEGFYGLDFFGTDAPLLSGGATATDLALGVGKATPATSESGNQQCTIIKDDVGSGSEGAAGQQKSDHDEEEAKKLARMQRNRENAYISRQRKKQQMMELQQQVSQYRTQYTQLSTFVQRLVAENCLLRHHLGTACGKAGMPMPNIPSAVAAQNAATATRAATTTPQQQPLRGLNGMPLPMPMAARPGGVMPPGMVGGTVPLVPRVPPMQQQAAAAVVPPQPTASADPQGRAAPVPERQPRKRARTLTGAGAAFVTLFSIFMFVAPYVPGPQGTPHLMGTSRPMMQALPAAADSSVQLERSSGRALQAFTGVQVETLEEDTGPSGAPLATMMNQTMEALLADPSSRKTEEIALLRLQELAPAAVLLDKPSPSGALSGGLMEASSAFPLLADSLFKSSGLQAPQTCEKVFEFDASSMPQNIRSRRSVEKFLMQSHGFKGRSLYGSGSKSLPLPIPDSDTISELGQLPAIEEQPVLDELDGSDVGDAIIPAGLHQEPLLVSVLLPANDSADGSVGRLSVIDKVFVVLLNPQNRYVTYSCGLLKPILV